jgi:hypothetical protein
VFASAAFHPEVSFLIIEEKAMGRAMARRFTRYGFEDALQ